MGDCIARLTECPALTEKQILFLAAVSSGVFALSQLIASFVSGSMALLGDSALMMVDVITYTTNMLAASYGSKIQFAAAIFSIVALAVTTV